MRSKNQKNKIRRDKDTGKFVSDNKPVQISKRKNNILSFVVILLLIIIVLLLFPNITSQLNFVNSETSQSKELDEIPFLQETDTIETRQDSTKNQLNEIRKNQNQ